MRKRISLLIAALMLALTMSFGGVAFAKITPVDTACTNNGGNQAGGQQPTCTGGGQTQESENQNPSGAAPPGQNP
jgi:ABC-type microcin C transport system permease subunit YejB